MSLLSVGDAAPFIILDTPASGRGAFARTGLQSGTPVLSTQVIAAHVILREYKREVCAQCFGYWRGTALKIRDLEAGAVFCGTQCQAQWRTDASDTTISALASLEGFIKKKSKYSGEGGAPDSVDSNVHDAPQAPPSVQFIDSAWQAVESTAQAVLQARRHLQAKPHRRALHSALAASPSADHLSFLLSAVLTRALRPGVWSLMLRLVANDEPYSGPNELHSHIRSYIQLLAILPSELLDYVTPETCREVVKRDSHNSFGIRSLDDGGDEFFGFAVWPEASFFNHSCSPNLVKRRVARSWEFWAARAVEDGEELTISYLGGEERDLDLAERRSRLKTVWGFNCGCQKCIVDATQAELAKS